MHFSVNAPFSFRTLPSRTKRLIQRNPSSWFPIEGLGVKIEGGELKTIKITLGGIELEKLL